MTTLNGFLGNASNAINQMMENAMEQGNVALGGAVQLSDMQKQMMQMGVDGMLATTGLEMQSTQANVMMDAASMGQRAAMTGVAKQADQFAYNEMMREKLTNLFMDMEKQRTDNAFTRAKSAVQSMKY